MSYTYFYGFSLQPNGWIRRIKNIAQVRSQSIHAGLTYGSRRFGKTCLSLPL